MHVEAGELAALAATVRELLAKQVHPTLPLADALLAPDSVWPRLAGELGLAGMLVAPEFGGLDLGLEAAATVAEELGRACYGGPFRSSCVEASALLGALEHDVAHDLLTGMADGGRVSAVALEPGTMSLTGHGAQRTLDGTTGVVTDLEVADTLLVALRVDGVQVVAAVDDPNRASGTVHAVTGLDLGRRLATMQFANTPATVLAEGSDAERAVGRALVHRGAVVGADALGVAAHALELAVGYAGKREQFGRLIGSFQAVKHTLADLHVRLQVARSALAFALADGTCLGMHAVLAKAPEAAVTITTEALQLHGGIGFTWEYPAHVLLRRARADAALFGTPAYHRRQLFRILEDRGPT